MCYPQPFAMRIQMHLVHECPIHMHAALSWAGDQHMCMCTALIAVLWAVGITQLTCHNWLASWPSSWPLVTCRQPTDQLAHGQFLGQLASSILVHSKVLTSFIMTKTVTVFTKTTSARRGTVKGQSGFGVQLKTRGCRKAPQDFLMND